MKIVSHEMVAIKEKLALEARNSGELIDQIKNNIMETKKVLCKSSLCAEEDTTKCKEDITKRKEEVTKELEVVKQELQATKEQMKRSLIISNALIVLMLVLICFYMHYAKIQNLESELMAKIINL